MLLKIIQLYMPGFVKKKKLTELFRLTADAFQVGMPELQGLPFSGRLSAYADFTREQAENCLHSGSVKCNPNRELLLEEVKSRLYENSFAFGKKLRKSLHILTWEESAEALKTVYGLIGIDFLYGSPNGSAANRDGFEIRKCFFSSYYSEEVCKLISSLDEGLAAGLSDGGKLEFTQRITDGSGCCKGCLLQR